MIGISFTTAKPLIVVPNIIQILQTFNNKEVSDLWFAEGIDVTY